MWEISGELFERKRWTPDKKLHTSAVALLGADVVAVQVVFFCGGWSKTASDTWRLQRGDRWNQGVRITMKNTNHDLDATSGYWCHIANIKCQHFATWQMFIKTISSVHTLLTVTAENISSAARKAWQFARRNSKWKWHLPNNKWHSANWKLLKQRGVQE